MPAARRLIVLTLAATLMLGTTGCATGIAQWIVRTRDHQGDVALSQRHDTDASKAYQLALQIDSQDAHARLGLTAVQLRIAQTEFTLGHFDDAIAALNLAAKYSPDDEKIAAVRAAIQQAQIARDIVVSNYPAYEETGTSLRRGYANLKIEVQNVMRALARFDYTFDTADLSNAIGHSYVLDEEVTRLTSRLVQYRQLVESGVPEHDEQPLAPPASLLPLP